MKRPSCSPTGRGSFVRIEPASGKQLFSTSTKAVQPVAIATAISGSKAYFADRKGLVSALDLGSGELLWSKNADEGGKAIFDDLIVSDKALWCYSKAGFPPLSTATGERLMATISNASTPPFAAGGYVWTALKGGRLVAHDPATGEVAKSLTVDGEFASRPARPWAFLSAPSSPARLSCSIPLPRNRKGAYGH